jgi:Lanthionine synthetase C-like protein
LDALGARAYIRNMPADREQYRLTRRNFLGSGVAAGVAGPLPALIATSAAAADPTQSPYSEDYLTAAKQAAHWIRSAQVPRERGIAWLPDPDHPDKTVTIGPDNTIYSGSAGVVLFFLELARATGDASYLRDASLGSDYLAASWPTLVATQNVARRDRGLSFDQGLAGTAFSLAETWKATQQPSYREAALAATRDLVSRAGPAGAGIEWLPSPAVGLGGGVVLYLLYAARTFHEQEFLQLARHAGDRIVELGEPDPRGGMRWQGQPAQGQAGGLAPDTYYPNFELGTAGVAFVLARLYEETRQPKFLEAARAGARHIQSIATVQGDSALVYYREPDLKDLYYLGYCHGPAGTARLFYQLHKVTGEHEYLEWTEKLARGIVRSGVPEKLTPGYWNVACQCCGSAAVTDLFLSLWLSTGKTQYRDFARRVADQLISREDDLDGMGYRWYQAWTRVKPWEVNAETGYKIGAAGIGAALLHAHLAVQNRYAAILFPDNPFPHAQHT